MSAGEEFSDLQLIQKYLELRDELAARAEGFELLIKPIKDGMTLIENVFLARLNERKAQNSKTDIGTAFKVSHLNVKIIDRMAYLQHVLDNWMTHGADMLKVGATTGEIRKYIDKHKEAPPGIETETKINVNIRKT